MAGVRLALGKLTDDLSGALGLRLVGMSDDLVHSFNAQSGLGGQIIDDRADNAAQGRQLFQDESGEGFSELTPIPDCAHNHFTAPLPQRSPFAISQLVERQVLFFFDLTGYRSSPVLMFHCCLHSVSVPGMMGTNRYRKAAKRRRIRDNQMVLTGTMQHPFWGDVSLLADAKR